MCINYMSSSALHRHACEVFSCGVPPSSDHGGNRLRGQDVSDFAVYTNYLGALGQLVGLHSVGLRWGPGFELPGDATAGLGVTLGGRRS